MTYSDALNRFLNLLSQREVAHKSKHYPNLKPNTFSVYEGRKFDKIVANTGGSRHVYAFIRKSDGAIIKPASWRAPEPRQYSRGNIYNDFNPLEGTNVYGVDYLR